MKKHSVQRSGSRKSIHQPVSFELSELESGRPRSIVKSGLGMDISPGGMGLTTDYPLKEGDVLKLFFPVAAVNASLPVYTEVVWSKPTNGEYRAGLRFLA